MSRHPYSDYVVPTLPRPIEFREPGYGGRRHRQALCEGACAPSPPRAVVPDDEKPARANSTAGLIRSRKADRAKGNSVARGGKRTGRHSSEAVMKRYHQRGQL